MDGRRKPLIGLVVLVALATVGSQWWAARAQRSVGRQVAELAQPGDLRMLASTTCSICTTARVWFKAHDVKFDECFIENDRDCALLFEATRSPGTPVILVRGQPQIGFDPRRLLAALSRPS